MPSWHNASSERFRSKKLSQKKKGKKPFMFSHEKYGLSLSYLSKLFMPLIRWDTKKAGVHSITSHVGRQHVSINSANGRGVNTRFDLQKIYRKIYNDICMSPQLMAQLTDIARPQENVNTSQKLLLEGLTDAQISDLVQNDMEMPTLVCHSFKRTFELTNVLNTVMYVEVNEWVPKEDLSDDPTKMWQDGLVRSGSIDGKGSYGLTLWPTSQVAPTHEFTGYDTSMPGLRPWKTCKELWNAWYVLKSTKYKIEPGSSVKHTVVVPGFKCSFSNLWHKEKYDKLFIQGLTIFMQFIQIGEKCFDGTMGDQAKSYMKSDMHTDYHDRAIWSMKPKCRSYFRILTHPPEDFSVEVDQSSFYPVAAVPTILVPNGSVVTAQTIVDFE